MILQEIIEKTDRDFPPELAMKWDNPGLQVGRRTKEVQKVFIALDATDRIIQDCILWRADLLLTHHPLIMEGVKKVSCDDYPGEKILTLAEHGIAHYAMHTNYDIARMGELAASMLCLGNTRVLEKTGEDEQGNACGIGVAGLLPERMTAESVCELVKTVFHLDTVRLFGNPTQEVQMAAVCPGAGKSLVGEALSSGAQIYVTGDIGHHDGIDAVDQNLLIIDAGHYGIEHIFLDDMEKWMKDNLPELDVKKADIHPPFLVL